MLIYEMHYKRHGRPATKYIYAYSREDAMRKATKYKTLTALHIVGYR